MNFGLNDGSNVGWACYFFFSFSNIQNCIQCNNKSHTLFSKIQPK